MWGGNLRRRRQELGISQNHVAIAAGIKQQSVARFESGQQIPTDRTKVALARALGSSPGELFPWPPMDELDAAS